MAVITLSRQYGSLGDEIADLVADRLGTRIVGQEIIAEVAHRLGVPVAAVRSRDERESQLVTDLVRTMQRLYPATIFPPGTGETTDLDDVAYLDVISQVVQEAGRSGNAVIVGRGATWILKNAPRVLHVLVVASLRIRVARVMEAEQVTESQAQRRTKEVDANRARYVRHLHRSDWLEPTQYDLVINTDRCSVATAASLICALASELSAPD